MAAFREWEKYNGERFAELRGLRHPVLVVHGFHDEMIPVPNSYRLSENLPNAVLLVLPRRRAWLAIPVFGIFHETCGSVPVLRLRVGRPSEREPCVR